MVAQSGSKSQPTVQVPAAALFEVQKRSVGQPLRPVARAQPSTHKWVTPSQIRPEVAEPQSASLAQPQNTLPAVAPAWQRWPSGLVAQALESPPAPVVQSTQPWLAGSQTGAAEKRLHSALLLHPPHAPPIHTGACAEQSAAVKHCTHCPLAQIAFAPWPTQPLASEHATHWWAAQVGAAALVQSLLLLHATHWPISPSELVSQSELVWPTQPPGPVQATQV